MIKRLARRFVGQTELPKEIGLCIQDYSQALEQINMNNLVEAENRFLNCIFALEKRGLLGNDGHNHLLKRLALVQRGMGKHEECESNLDLVYNNSISNTKHSLLEAQLNLIKQCLHTNLPKAIKIGDEISSTIPQENLSEFNFIYGTGLVMSNNFTKGKSLLNESYLQDPGNNKGYIIHNLACAQWWHMDKYNDKDMNSLSEEDKEEFKTAYEDFKVCVENFKKSITHQENLVENYDIDKHKLLTANSYLSITNVGEIYLQNLCHELTLKWLRKAIDVCFDYDRTLSGRSLALLGVALKYQKDYEKAELAFKKALKSLNGKMDFNEFFTLQVYGYMMKSIGKNAEGQELLKKAEKVQDYLYYWSEKACQVYLPMWHL